MASGNHSTRSGGPGAGGGGGAPDQGRGSAVADGMIAKLLEARGKPPGTQVHLEEADVRALVVEAREVFMSQAALLELEAPVKLVGDIHGQYYDLLRLFEYGGFPPEANYVFLGDYVDRGRQSLETVCLLLCYKVKYPENFFLLRGNHEAAGINRIYGFYDECRRRHSTRLWKAFSDVFNCMPVAAVVDDKIFCCHGGLSPHLLAPGGLDSIRRLARPSDVPDEGLMSDLLWSDPEEGLVGFADSDRGVSFHFGSDVVDKFLKLHDFDLICRAHQR